MLHSLISALDWFGQFGADMLVNYPVASVFVLLAALFGIMAWSAFGLQNASRRIGR
jgi:hypothetical protein